MIFWSVFLTLVALGILSALKGWAWVKARADKLAHKADKQGRKYAARTHSTLESELDDWVNESKWLWPALKPLPLFWIAVLFSLGMITLDIMFGWSRGGSTVSAYAIVYILLFVGADLALPVVAVRSDKGTAEWHEFNGTDRTAGSFALICLFTFLSMVVVIGSTSEVATTTSATRSAQVMSQGEVQKQIAQKTKLRDELVERRIASGGLSREALEARTRETQAAAEREANRKRCASKCEQLKAEAVKWEAQAADARREDELNEELAVLTTNLSSADNLRDEADPLARFGMEVFSIPEEHTRNWGLTFLGLLFAVGTTILWLMVGDEAGKARAAEWKRRGEIADAERASMGKPPKYTAPLTETLALAGPEAKSGDTIVINMTQAEDMRRRFANDADLLETDALFGTLIAPADEGVVTIAELYRLYQVDKLRRDPNSRYMTQPTMAQKLYTISQHRDDIEVTSDGRIIGWQAVKAETATAAE